VAGGYSHNGYLPSFVGFAPADRPEIVGLVAVAEPKGFEYHGGQVAAPVFGAIARQVMLYQGIRPERQKPGSWPGQTLLASAPPLATAPPPIVHEGDFEDLLPPGDPPPLPPDTDGQAVAEPIGGRESASPNQSGGRSHAPF
jgi:hypothetical protein